MGFREFISLFDPSLLSKMTSFQDTLVQTAQLLIPQQQDNLALYEKITNLLKNLFRQLGVDILCQQKKNLFLTQLGNF